MAVYKFNVEMTCGGCSGAVSRVLAGLDGVKRLEVSHETKKVIIETDKLEGTQEEKEQKEDIIQRLTKSRKQFSEIVEDA